LPSHGLEETGRPLYLVDDDEPLQAAERLLRRLEPAAVDGSLEIEVGASGTVRGDGAREGSLPALPGPGQGDGRMHGERRADALGGSRPTDDHGAS